MFRILGLLCFGFAILDFGLYTFGVADLTGVSWSPIAAGVAGSVLVRLDGADDEGEAASEAEKTA